MGGKVLGSLRYPEGRLNYVFLRAAETDFFWGRRYMLNTYWNISLNAKKYSVSLTISDLCMFWELSTVIRLIILFSNNKFPPSQAEQLRVFQEAVQEVPKSGEVWCDRTAFYIFYF